MLSIRLMRTGKAHAPHYRIVVQEKRSKLNGKAVDQIGHYHPAQAEKLLVINKERADYWISKGAQPSDTVTNLFVKQGIFDESRKIKRFYTAKPVEVVDEAPVPAEEAPVADEMPETPEVAPVEDDASEATQVATEEETPEVVEEAAPEA